MSAPISIQPLQKLTLDYSVDNLGNTVSPITTPIWRLDGYAVQLGVTTSFGVNNALFIHPGPQGLAAVIEGITPLPSFNVTVSFDTQFTRFSDTTVINIISLPAPPPTIETPIQNATII